MLLKMEFALLNDKLADSVVEQCLICLKEEWMKLVKFELLVYCVLKVMYNRKTSRMTYTEKIYHE